MQKADIKFEKLPKQFQRTIQRIVIEHANEYVEYILDTDDDGKSQATSVTGIAGGPLLCETNTSRQSREGSDSDERRSGRIQRRNATRHTDSSTEEIQTTQ